MRTLPAAEQEDLRLTAELQGISLEEAYTTYGWQDDFAQYVDTLRETAPDQFAGAAITGPTSAWVGFHGDVPEGLRDRLDDKATLDRVSVGVSAQKGFNESELLAATEQAHKAAVGVGGEVTVTLPDAAAGTIEVTVPSRLTARARQAVVMSGAAVRTPTGELSQNTSSSGAAWTVRVRSDDTTTAGFDTVYGGRRVHDRRFGHQRARHLRDHELRPTSISPGSSAR